MRSCLDTDIDPFSLGLKGTSNSLDSVTPHFQAPAKFVKILWAGIFFNSLLGIYGLLVKHTFSYQFDILQKYSYVVLMQLFRRRRKNSAVNQTTDSLNFILTCKESFC